MSRCGARIIRAGGGGRAWGEARAWSGRVDLPMHKNSDKTGPELCASMRTGGTKLRTNARNSVRMVRSCVPMHETPFRCTKLRADGRYAVSRGREFQAVWGRGRVTISWASWVVPGEERGACGVARASCADGACSVTGTSKKWPGPDAQHGETSHRTVKRGRFTVQSGRDEGGAVGLLTQPLGRRARRTLLSIAWSGWVLPVLPGRGACAVASSSCADGRAASGMGT